MQVINGELQVLRCARGYSPLSLELTDDFPTTLAVGGHLKNTVAITQESQVFLSQHIGDLDNARTNDVFQKTIEDFKCLYDLVPEQVVHDLHPDYLSTHNAQAIGLASYPVQHHVAHVLAGMLDNQLDGRVLGVAWDGTGYGTDGTVWGGEWFLFNDNTIKRVAHLRSFALPGGEIAVREPQRSALGALYEVYKDDVFTDLNLPVLQAFALSERNILHTMLNKHIRSPQTTSMGRLFDAVAAILNLCQKSTFEGQAAMAVEFMGMQSDSTLPYPFKFDGTVLDWRPLLKHVVNDRVHDISIADIARQFHNTLADMIVQVAKYVGEDSVLLTGGCFQNRVLTRDGHFSVAGGGD